MGLYGLGVTGTSMKNRICGAFMALLLLCAGSVCQAAEPRRLHVVILPTENMIGLQVWESKYSSRTRRGSSRRGRSSHRRLSDQKEKEKLLKL